MKDIFALYLCVCIIFINEYQQFRKEDERAKIQNKKNEFQMTEQRSKFIMIKLHIYNNIYGIEILYRYFISWQRGSAVKRAM